MSELQDIKITQANNKISDIASPIFWLGFIIYSASYTISETAQVNYVICNIFQIIGMFLMLPSAVILISIRIESIFFKVLFLVFILWQILTVIRGIELNYQIAKVLLFDPNMGIFLYIAPVVALIPVSRPFLKRTFQTIIVLSIIYLLYDILFLRQLLYPQENMRSQAIFEYFTQQLSLSSGFMLLTFIYHKRRVNLFILFTIFVTFMLAVIRARRGLIFMTFSMLFFTYLIYQFENKTKVINIILSLFILTSITFVGVRIYNEHRKNTFSLITERIGQRTRSEVERYFYRDMQTRDWLFGKGFNAEYFCPGVTEGVGRITIYRKVVETGYLQVILNGGIVSLTLMLLIIIPAMIKGIFYSRNILTKAAGIWIFLFLLYMYPGTITKFSMHYLLVWVSVGICFSEKIRNLTDENISAMLLPVS